MFASSDLLQEHRVDNLFKCVVLDRAEHHLQLAVMRGPYDLAQLPSLLGGLRVGRRLPCGGVLSDLCADAGATARGTAHGHCPGVLRLGLRVGSAVLVRLLVLGGGDGLGDALTHEDAVHGLAAEVAHALYHAIVLADGLIQDNAYPATAGEFGLADEGHLSLVADKVHLLPNLQVGRTGAHGTRDAAAANMTRVGKKGLATAPRAKMA
mmetsp:Transcript_127860/g.368220  ORF Transcript_127860/g.368220 Transcript_127860/m.368220 type:complete len:209 (-) Transcript_127860:2-628(-)